MARPRFITPFHSDEHFYESEERFRLLSESSLTGIYLIQDGRFTYVNSAFADMFGYEVREVLTDLSMTDIIFQEDRPLVVENIRRRVDGEDNSIRYTFRGLHRSGSVIFVEVHGRRIQYQNKPGVLGTLIDISEAKRTEAALLASEEQYRALYNETPSMFFTLDTEGIITSTNDFVEKTMGYSKRQLQGQPFFNHFHEDDKETAQRRFNICKQTSGQVYNWNLRKIRQDGSPIWVEEFARSVIGPDGKINVLVVSQDITERVQLEESLKFAQSIFDQASIGIFVILEDNQIIDANKHACHTLGYTREELCKLSIRDIDPTVTKDQLTRFNSQVAIKKSITTKTTHKRKNGETFSVQIFTSALTHKNMPIKVSFVQDISEIEQAREQQKQLETKLEQVQKLEAIGRLAGGIAHDLNNLLTPILGYTGMLVNDETIHDKAKKNLAHMSKAAIGARDLIKQLLAFSRKQVFEYQPLNVNQILDGFIDLIRRTIREDIEISLHKAKDLKPALLDQGQIEQVLMNLIVNGSDAMPHGGKLSIETQMTVLDENYSASHPGATPGNYVMLGVSDTGCGMDEETLSKIFEPFFSTKGEQGTGLGLATAYGIIKQHKGSIWVYSEKGVGTSFKIYLPVAQQTEVGEKPHLEIKSSTKGTETILLVEDNEEVRNTVFDILCDKGYRVFAADCGKAALEIASSDTNFDMLLTDLIMPDMNGKELFTLISEQNPTIKVLYMSGYTDNIVIHHGAINKDIQFIQKPFTSQVILYKVRTILSI